MMNFKLQNTQQREETNQVLSFLSDYGQLIHDCSHTIISEYIFSSQMELLSKEKSSPLAPLQYSQPFHDDIFRRCVEDIQMKHGFKSNQWGNEITMFSSNMNLSLIKGKNHRYKGKRNFLKNVIMYYLVQEIIQYLFIHFLTSVAPLQHLLVLTIPQNCKIMICRNHCYNSIVSSFFSYCCKVIDNTPHPYSIFNMMKR